MVFIHEAPSLMVRKKRKEKNRIIPKETCGLGVWCNTCGACGSSSRTGDASPARSARVSEGEGPKINKDEETTQEPLPSRPYCSEPKSGRVLLNAESEGNGARGKEI